MGDVRTRWPLDASVLEGIDGAAFEVDPDGSIRLLNDLADREYARPGDCLVGRPLTDLFAHGDRTAVAAVVRQVLEGEAWQGHVEVPRRDGTVHDAEVTCSPLFADGAVRGLLCVVVDASQEGDRLRAFRLLGERLTRLARVAGELARADDVETVNRIITSHSADAVGATIASLLLLEGEDQLRLVGLRGGEPGEEEQWARFPVAARTPAGDVIRTGKRVLVVGADAIAEQYPDSNPRGERSVVCLPLNVSNRTVGVIGLSFPGVRMIDTAELEFLEILADSCAQALQRIESQAAAATSAERLAFLADASAELASSLDYEATLKKVAQLVVPTFADWCAIDIVGDGRLHRLAVAHVDPAKVELARTLEERYPSNPDAPRGTWHVMRTGRSELIAEVTDEMLVVAAVDEEHLRIARELQLRSGLIVPLVARGKVRGVITWVAAESDRRYTEDDVGFAEDLARRAAVAIDNAELYSHTLAAAVRLQEAVLPERMPDVPGFEIASYYDPSGRTDVGGDFYDVIPLVDGRLAVFVGDVMGRGVEAAAAMAQMRAAVRAYTAIDPQPSRVLGRLDRMFAQYPTDQIVTLAFLVVDSAHDRVTVANAGHPPPVVLREAGGAEQLPDADGCPLGVLAEDRHEQTYPMYAGDTLLVFTDGLIERRDEDIDVGQRKVVDAMPMLSRPDLDGALRAMVDTLRETARDDDVAAVVVRRT